MSSTISGINEAQVDARIIPALRSILPLLSMFSHVIEEEDRITSDTVQVPVAVDPTIGNKTAGTFVAAAGELAGATVTYNRFRGGGWDAVEGTMRASLLANYWLDKAEGAVYGAAKDIVDYVLALITAANFGNTDADKLIVAPADFGQLDAAQLWGKAKKKIKRQKQVFIMNTDFATALFGDSSMALINATSGKSLESAALPNFLDMNQVHYSDFPTNSQNLGGAVIGSGALAVALAKPSMFIKSGDGDCDERRVITDPDSGISCMYTVKTSAGGTKSGEVTVLYGVATTGLGAVVRLVTA